MPNKRRTNRSLKQSRVVSKRPVDPIITAQRFKVPNAHIPQHNVAPTVRRTVRIVHVLTQGVPSFNFAPSDFAAADAVDYTGTSTPRYATLRLLHCKFWAESPANLSVSQQVYGLIATDYHTGFSISDRPTTGSRLNAIGLRMPFMVRSTYYLCTDTTTFLVTILCDTTIASATDFTVTCDFTVEFTA
jgi:hypothetical protein